MTDAEIQDVADALRAAELGRAPIPPVIRTYPAMEAADSYRIQLANIQRRLDAGAVVVGHKVGLSSAAMQQMFGVNEPDYGHLLAEMQYFEGDQVDALRYCFPKAEPEVAFILGDDLPGEGCTEADVIAATEAVTASIELVDSRIVDWQISIADTIADNASSAGFILGAARVKPADVDLLSIPATLYRNGENVGSGTSDAVLGNPATSVAWLANKVAAFGVRLKAGHVILPGSITRAVDVRPGDEVVADFGPLLGSVTLNFAPKGTGE